MATAESQAAFVAKVGPPLTPQAWWNMENGGRPSLDTAFLLVQRLRVSQDWIYHGVEALMPADVMHKIKEIEAADEAPPKPARRRYQRPA